MSSGDVKEGLVGLWWGTRRVWSEWYRYQKGLAWCVGVKEGSMALMWGPRKVQQKWCDGQAGFGGIGTNTKEWVLMGPRISWCCWNWGGSDRSDEWTAEGPDARSQRRCQLFLSPHNCFSTWRVPPVVMSQWWWSRNSKGDFAGVSGGGTEKVQVGGVEGTE